MFFILIGHYKLNSFLYSHIYFVFLDCIFRAVRESISAFLSLIFFN